MGLAEETYNNQLVSDIAKNILTLRYNPSLESIIPKLTWKDFIPNSSDLKLEIIEEKIEQYIKNQLTTSISSISISLSGGIDSTLVLAYIRKLYPDLKIHAISVKFSESVDESQDAKKIADYFNAEHHIINVENYLEILPRAIGITRMPFWDNHWYFVAQFANTKSKFLASGDGGDEIFGGYTFRYQKFISLTHSNSTPLEKTKSYLNCHERDWVPDQEKIFHKNLNFSWNQIHSSFFSYFDNSLDGLTQVFLADYNGKLRHNFSHVNNSINSEFGLHTVTPLLSNDLISILSHCKSKYKYDQTNNIGKVHLRKLLKKHNISHLISNQKLGFSVNTKTLWKNFGKDLFHSYLDSGRTIADKFINRDWIFKHLNNNDLDIRIINKLLGILAFEIWYRIFVTKEMNSNTKLSI